MRVLIISLFTTLYFQVISQDILEIDFVEANPIWEFLVYNQEFVDTSGMAQFDAYTSMKPNRIFRSGNILLLQSIAKNHYGDTWGYILDKIDLQTGEPYWRINSTYFNDNVQDYYSNMYLRADGNIDLLGMQRYGPEIEWDGPFSLWLPGSRANSLSRKTHDFETGALIHFYDNSDSLKGKPYYQTPIVEDNEYALIRQGLTDTSNLDIYRFGFLFNKLDANYELATTSPDCYVEYQTPDTLGSFSIGANLPILKVDEDTYVYKPPN